MKLPAKQIISLLKKIVKAAKLQHFKELQDNRKLRILTIKSSIMKGSK